MPQPIFDPGLFRIPPGVAHVCAGGETPFLHRHDAALAAYAADKSAGSDGRAAQEAAVLHARTRAAAAWGCAVADIGLCAHVAEGMGLLVESLDWRPGDSVLLDPDEYPSVAAPLLLRGVRPRLVSMLDPDAVAAAAGPGTRMIAVSHVSFLTGARVPLAALRRVADAAGALLVVDHTQAAGWLPIEAGLADFAFAATYKWLLGMTGTAIAYWNRARQPGWAPRSAGWHSIAAQGRPDWSAVPALVPDAMRFCRGNPAHGPAYVLGAALDFLAGHDAAAVHRHVAALSGALLQGLRDLRIPSTTPADPARHGASVCIAHADAAGLTDALKRRGVWAWNGRGRVRCSFHGYNGDADVARILAALRAEWRG